MVPDAEVWFVFIVIWLIVAYKRGQWDARREAQKAHARQVYLDNLPPALRAEAQVDARSDARAVARAVVLGELVEMGMPEDVVRQALVGTTDTDPKVLKLKILRTLIN